jgi:hypothetical protein
MIRTVVLLALVSFALTACIQNWMFDCKKAPHRYCPKD